MPRRCSAALTRSPARRSSSLTTRPRIWQPTVTRSWSSCVQLANKMLSTVRRRTTAELRGRRGRARIPDFRYSLNRDVHGRGGDRWHTGFVDALGVGGLLGQVEGRTAADVLAWLSTTLTWRSEEVTQGLFGDPRVQQRLTDLPLGQQRVPHARELLRRRRWVRSASSCSGLSARCDAGWVTGPAGAGGSVRVRAGALAKIWTPRSRVEQTHAWTRGPRSRAGDDDGLSRDRGEGLW